MQPVKLPEKFARFHDHWSPRIVAQVNDFHVKLVKLSGEFVWHAHEETDELFLVHRGQLTIRLREPQGERSVHLGPGALFVVPRGVEHCPVAEAECEVLLLEPAGTVNTGDAGGERTVDNPEWI